MHKDKSLNETQGMKEEIKFYITTYEIDPGTLTCTDTTWRNIKRSRNIKAG